MTASKSNSTAKGKSGDNANTLNVEGDPQKPSSRQLAEIGLNPAAHGMATAHIFNPGSFGKVEVTDVFAIITDQIAAVGKGDLSHQRAMLAGQATALNSIFTELARRAGANMGEYVSATQIYMRLALKAQSQCRSTVEALDRLVNGHEQTVKHVHVGQGGQAVVADQFHQHTEGSGKNEKINEQSHAAGSTDNVAALPSPNPLGNGVPIPSREREAAMQDARGD